MVKRLLVVDDEPNLLQAVAAVLRDEHFEIETARSGREALIAVARNLPDLGTDIAGHKINAASCRINGKALGYH